MCLFHRFESPREKEKEDLLISTIECIWGSVCGCLRNEEAFFHASGMSFLSCDLPKGIFLMIDLLERGTHLVKKHALGCLLDMLENPKVCCLFARSHFTF